MQCQLKYVKYRYLTIFNGFSKIQIMSLIILSYLICVIAFNTIDSKTLTYIMYLLWLIPLTIFYIQGIIYCKNKGKK